MSIPLFYKKNKNSKVLNQEELGTFIHLTGTLNLFLKVDQEFIVNEIGKKFGKQYIGSNHNLNRSKTCCI